MLTVTVSRDLEPLLISLKIEHIRAELVNSLLTWALIHEPAQVVLLDHLHTQVKHLGIAQGPEHFVSCLTESNLRLEVDLLGSLHCQVVYLGWHLPRHVKEFLVTAKPVDLADAFQLERVAFKLDGFTALYSVPYLGCVLWLTSEDFEYDTVSLE